MSVKENNDILVIARRAYDVALLYQHEMVTLEHVLAALVENEEVIKCLASLSIDIQTLVLALASFFDSNFIERREGVIPNKSNDFETLFARVIGSIPFSASQKASVLDILLHLTQMPHEDSYAITALAQIGLTTLALKKYIAHGTPQKRMNKPQIPESGDMSGMTSEAEPSTQDEALQIIGKYCVNLNEQAKLGKIDPLIGRANVVEQITLTVSRRTKNNVVLVGPPGCGKTAIVEGLAHRIVNGDVPEVLKSSTVFSLDIASLVAGTRFRGDFEERMKNVLKSLSFITGAIVFIDEIHTIMGAGSGGAGGNSMDAANLLKPALAKGTLRCIGSTTEEEYRKYFEKDRALLRRFKRQEVGEPSIEESKLILRGLKDVYEKFHNVSYTEEALDAAVDLTARYIHSAVLPDKAIDVMDSAGARKRVDAGGGNVSGADIEIEVSKIAVIPAQQISESDTSLLSRLETELKSSVYGQDKALNAVTDSVFISRAGLKPINKPSGSYLFTGPTGTGKTETARALARSLNVELIKFDMSEYMEKHAVSKLIGSPPGYVGFAEGGAGDGLLVNAIDSHPNCVLLLDEIEKAHPDIFNILLQVMDDAKLTNSRGKTVSFRNVILIMTSNAGSSAAEKSSIGFNKETVGEINPKALANFFSPEFRNRLDAIIHYDRLRPESMLKIVDKFIASLNSMTTQRNVALDIDQESKDWLAKKGYDPKMGARPLERVINDTIKKPLSRLMLIGRLVNGGTASVRVVNNEIQVS